MGFKENIPDVILVLLSVLIALLVNSLLQGLGRHWAAIISLITLFGLLYTAACMRKWTASFRLPVIGSSRLSELFLGLTLMISGLAVSWFAGVMISRTYTEVEGVLASLCMFGFLMLLVSAGRNWQ